MTQTLSDPMLLDQGATYRAIVGGSENAFFVGKSAIKKGFEENGFGNVIASFEPLPGWPADQIVPEPRDGWRAYVEGMWIRPSSRVAKPSRIIQAWKYRDADPGPFRPPLTQPDPPGVPPFVWISLSLTLIRWLF